MIDGVYGERLPTVDFVHVDLPRGEQRPREFITLLGGATAAWPLAVRAQQADKVRRIGFLRVGAPPPSFIGPLQRALKDLGYVEGKNFVFEYGLAKSVAELPGLAADLVRRQVDVLVASGTPAVIPRSSASRCSRARRTRAIFNMSIRP